jgi:hypothetical protein
MCGNSLHGNRETLETPPQKPCGGRSEKAIGRTSDMHVSRESDDSIVPEKRANKAGTYAAAESVEGRGSTKGNATRTLLAPDSVPGQARHRIEWNTKRLSVSSSATRGRSRMR